MFDRRKWDELTDDQRWDLTHRRQKMLLVSSVALVIGYIFIVVLAYLFVQYITEKGEQRDKQFDLNACANLYDAKPGNPYVPDLREDHPDCKVRGKRSQGPSGVSGLPPPRTVIARPPASRTAPATATAKPKPPTPPEGSKSGGPSSSSASAATPTPSRSPLACAHLRVLGLRIALGC